MKINSAKNYKVKQLGKGQYLYTIQGVQMYLQFDCEQTNGMVSGGFGMWKAYPVYKDEILWSAPFDADVQLWYDRKRGFVTDLRQSPDAIINDIKSCLEAHMKFLDRCNSVGEGWKPTPNADIQAYNNSKKTFFDSTPVGGFVNEFINS